MRRFFSWRGQEEDCRTLNAQGRENGPGTHVSPDRVYAIVLCLQFLGLLALIIPHRDGKLLLAYLVVLFSMILRSRVPIAPRFMLIDCSLFCTASVVDPTFASFLFVFILYFSYHNTLLFAAIPVGLSLFFLDGAHWILPIQALLSGVILHLWKRESFSLLEEADTLRQELYRSAQTELKLLSDYHDTDRLSQLKERHRLAEQLHDNLGHELTAAHLSVKSVGALLDIDEISRARTAQKKAEERLHAALQQLKTAVSRIEPDSDPDIRTITALFDRFIYPVTLTQKGDPSNIQPYHIQLMHAAVKEALTNIAKHSVPRRVDAVLEFTGSIMKTRIENDGIKASTTERPGNGLRYMRNRIEAVRGSLTTTTVGQIFRIIIILPIERV